MKLTALCSVLFLAALFVVGPKFSLEAKHRNYFSLNIGPVLPAPAYVVPTYPAYVQRTYVDSWGYPYSEAVVVQPSPVVYYPPRPAVSFGFGWLFR